MIMLDSITDAADYLLKKEPKQQLNIYCDNQKISDDGIRRILEADVIVALGTGVDLQVATERKQLAVLFPQARESHVRTLAQAYFCAQPYDTLLGIERYVSERTNGLESIRILKKQRIQMEACYDRAIGTILNLRTVHSPLVFTTQVNAQSN